MDFKSNKNVAVLDLDGVVIANPAEALVKTITNNDYWLNHWTQPEKATLNTEVVDLVQSLVSTNWQVVFLTARPERFRPDTERVLRRAGIFVRPNGVRPVVQTSSISNYPLLVMLDQHDVPGGSAGWKQSMIKKWLDAGNKIRFMIEDYRPNAEAIRCLVPVLLYERKKVSQHYSLHDCCGSFTECWCPKELGTQYEAAVARANS